MDRHGEGHDRDGGSRGDGPGHDLTGSGTGEPSAGPQTTRRSALWAGVAAALFLLVVLLVFILQNLKEVRVSFFWIHWRIPLALDLLFATVLGGLIVFVAGLLRMLEMRRSSRRSSHQRSLDKGR